MTAAQLGFNLKVAIAACDQEKQFLLKTGNGHFAAYDGGFGVLTEILDIAAGPMPRDTLTRFRMIGRVA